MGLKPQRHEPPTYRCSECTRYFVGMRDRCSACVSKTVERAKLRVPCPDGCGHTVVPGQPCQWCVPKVEATA